MKDKQAQVSFLNDIHSENFLVNLEQSIDAAFDNLEEKHTLVVIRNANYKEWKTPLNPWRTNAVKNCVAKKAKFFRLFQRFRAPSEEQCFKYYRAVVNKLVKASKKQYYAAFFSRNFNNSRKFFQEKNALCGREKKQSNIYLLNGNILLSELEDVVKALNFKFKRVALPRNDNVSTIVSDIAENEHSFVSSRWTLCQNFEV